MRASSGTRVGLLATGAVALVALVALGSSRSSVHLHGGRRPFGAHLLTGDVLVLVAALPLVALGVIAYALWERGRRLRLRDDDGPVPVSERRAPWWQRPLFTAVGLAVPAALLAALVLIPEGHHEQRVFPAGGTTPRPALPAGGGGGGGFGPHWWAIAALALGAAAAAALAAVRARSNDAAEDEEEPAPEREGLREAVDLSLAELEREPDPRRAVIRAYTGMESVLARHGLGRQPSEAPFEYLARSFADLRAGRAAGTTLTALFQRARFSRHAIDAGMKQEAIEALVDVRRELEAAR